MQLTLTGAHPMALDTEVAEMEDVEDIFGMVTMQACLPTLRSCQHGRPTPPDVASPLVLITVVLVPTWQACLTQRSSLRAVYKLVGRAHEIAFWQADEKLPVLDHFRQ